MASDAAYLEPTIDFASTSDRRRVESQFASYPWSGDVLTSLRPEPTRQDTTPSVRSGVDSTQSDGLPSFTSAKRHANVQPRIPGASTASSKYKDLAKQRGALAAKKLESGLTAAEQRELRMLSWAIGTMEMEQMEPSLKQLEGLVEMQRKLQKEVDRLVAVMR